MQLRKKKEEHFEIVAVKEKQELQQSLKAVADLDQLTKDREDKLKTKEDDITQLSQQITQITADQNKSKEQYDSITLEVEHVRKENKVIADKLAKVLPKARNISKEKEEIQDNLNKKLNDISKLQMEQDELNRKMCESCKVENAVASKVCKICKKEFPIKQKLVKEELSGGSINSTTQKNIIHKRLFWIK